MTSACQSELPFFSFLAKHCFSGCSDPFSALDCYSDFPFSACYSFSQATPFCAIPLLHSPPCAPVPLKLFPLFTYIVNPDLINTLIASPPSSLCGHFFTADHITLWAWTTGLAKPIYKYSNVRPVHISYSGSHSQCYCSYLSLVPR